MEFTATIKFTDEEFSQLAKDLMENYPEAGSVNCLKCIKWKYEAMEFTFWDEEEDKEHKLDKAKIEEGLKKFLQARLLGKYPGTLQGIPMTEYKDAGHWDAYDIDAVIQMALFDDLIYG